MDILDALKLIDPLVVSVKAKVKTDNWLHDDHEYHKLTIIWRKPVEKPHPAEADPS